MKTLLAFFFFFLAGVFITFPLIFNLGSLVIDLSDAPLIAYIQNWGIYSVLSGNISSLFHASIYYPYQNSLAYSDLHFSSALLSIPIFFLIKEPITTYNFTLLSSIIFLGFSVYLLCFYLTKNFFVSLFSGTLVIFSPAVLSTSTHIQVIGMQWFIFSLLFYLKFIDTQKTKFFVFSLLFFIFQMYNSFLPAYFIVFSYAIIFLYVWIYKRKIVRKIITKKHIVIFLTALVLTLPVIIPYYQVSKQFAFTRHITEAIHLGLQPEDLLFSSGFSKLAPFFNSLPFNQVSQNNEFKPGYLGFVFTILAIIVFVTVIRQFKKKDRLVNSFVTMAFTGFLLSLGPALHLGRHTIHDPFPIPLPYALFYYIIPGFQGLRNAARWEMLFILALAVLIAIILTKFLKKVSFKKRITVICLLFAGVIAEFNFPMQFVPITQNKDFPKVYSYLATMPKDSVIVEMPIYVWYMHPYVFDENIREYYATTHFLSMINGASGFSPPPWQVMSADLLRNFPSKETLKKLREMNVDYIIVHKKEYDRLAKDAFVVQEKAIIDGDTLIKVLTEEYNIKILKRVDDDYVFKL